MLLSEVQEKCKNISNFRGVFLRDTLPNYPNKVEMGILNLDSVYNNGTHWTLYYKNNEKCFYFDSFGHRPPKELMDYVKNKVWYSTDQLQELGTKYCGQLCVILAEILNKSKNFIKSVYELKEILNE